MQSFVACVLVLMCLSRLAAVSRVLSWVQSFEKVVQSYYKCVLLQTPQTLCILPKTGLIMFCVLFCVCSLWKQSSCFCKKWEFWSKCAVFGEVSAKFWKCVQSSGKCVQRMENCVQIIEKNCKLGACLFTVDTWINVTKNIHE